MLRSTGPQDLIHQAQSPRFTTAASAGFPASTPVLDLHPLSQCSPCPFHTGDHVFLAAGGGGKPNIRQPCLPVVFRLKHQIIFSKQCLPFILACSRRISRVPQRIHKSSLIQGIIAFGLGSYRQEHTAGSSPRPVSCRGS